MDDEVLEGDDEEKVVGRDLQVLALRRGRGSGRRRGGQGEGGEEGDGEVEELHGDG